MEENRVDHEGPEKKSVRSYQIIVLALVVVLGVISFVYFRQMNNLKKEYQIEKDTLTMRINEFIVDIDNLQVENADISANLDKERLRADSLIERLQSERNMNRTTIRKYEKELGTMRTIMRRYVEQIDSLNTLNRSLAEENLTMRREAASERQRAEAAEEMASELSRKVQAGATVKARDIALIALNANDKVVPRASRAERLRVDFILSANDIATPGTRNVYARITGPDGYVLAGNTESLFTFQGDKITYSAVREIDYQNDDLSVSLYYNGTGIESGTYMVEIFMDDAKIGRSEMILK